MENIKPHLEEFKIEELQVLLQSLDVLPITGADAMYISLIQAKLQKEILKRQEEESTLK